MGFRLCIKFTAQVRRLHTGYLEYPRTAPSLPLSAMAYCEVSQVCDCKVAWTGGMCKVSESRRAKTHERVRLAFTGRFTFSKARNSRCS